MQRTRLFFRKTQFKGYCALLKDNYVGNRERQTNKQTLATFFHCFQNYSDVGNYWPRSK